MWWVFLYLWMNSYKNVGGFLYNFFVIIVHDTRGMSRNPFLLSPTKYNSGVHVCCITRRSGFCFQVMQKLYFAAKCKLLGWVLYSTSRMEFATSPFLSHLAMLVKILWGMSVDPQEQWWLPFKISTRGPMNWPKICMNRSIPYISRTN